MRGHEQVTKELEQLQNHLKIPTWESVALAVIGNAKENIKTGVVVTTGRIAVARVRRMQKTPP